MLPLYSHYFEIEISEYQSSSITSSKSHAKKSTTSGTIHGKAVIRFSKFRLAVALAKTILTRDPKDSDLIKEVRAALYMLDSMIDTNKTSLRVCNGFRKKYRDFSKNSRTGELAQAISFIFSQEKLCYPIVMDFHGFLASQGSPESPNDYSSPDFALLAKSGDFKPSLLESKGTCPSTETNAVKGDLKDALNQCRSGLAFMLANCNPKLGAKSMFGTQVRVAESADSWSSVFSFCDPEDRAEDAPDPLAAARQYYSAYILITGNIELSKRLIDQRGFESAMNNLEETKLEGTTYFLLKTEQKRFNLFTPLLANQKNHKKQQTPGEWYIRKDLLIAIATHNRDLLSSALESLDVEEEQSNQSVIIFFRDGTACKIPD